MGERARGRVGEKSRESRDRVKGREEDEGGEERLKGEGGRWRGGRTVDRR